MLTFQRGKAAFVTAAILFAAYIGGCAVSSGPPTLQAPDIRRVSPQQPQRVYRVIAELRRLA